MSILFFSVTSVTILLRTRRYAVLRYRTASSASSAVSIDLHTLTLLYLKFGDFHMRETFQLVSACPLRSHVTSANMMRDWSAAHWPTIPGCEVLLKPMFCASFSRIRIKQVVCFIKTPPLPPPQATYLTNEFFTLP